MEGRRQVQYRTKANDVDAKGIVTVAVNGIGIKDSQGDISQPGSFKKTLKENLGRMRWFLNHRTDQLLGVPLEGREEGGNLIMVGQLNLNKQMGRDILEDYKLFAENGRTLEHSIGVQAVKRDPNDKARVLEWKMFEYSTLTSWGANPQTFLVDIKSASPERLREAMAFIKEAARRRYSDARLKRLEDSWNVLEKALEGSRMVTCPDCGEVFDYDAQPEHVFSDEVLSCARDYLRWMVSDCVGERIAELEPDIRAEVEAVIDAVKASGKDYSEKSITDVVAYVRCPHCWGRVYRTELDKDTTPAGAGTEPPQGTQDGVPEGAAAVKAANGTFFDDFNSCFPVGKDKQ